jgi:hypothetical protein
LVSNTAILIGSNDSERGKRKKQRQETEGKKQKERNKKIDR